MKKFALFLVIILFTTPAWAEGWEFDASFDARGAYGYADTAERFQKHQKRNQAFGDAELQLDATYDFDEDYSLNLNLDVMGGLDKEIQDYNQGRWGEEVYAIFDSPYGSLHAGQMHNVAYQFYEGAPRVGILKNNFDMVNFINNPNWKRDDKNAKFATLNTAYINTDGVAPKINYISPEFYGTKFGATYIPDTYNKRGLINKHTDNTKDYGYVAALSTEQDLGLIDALATASFAQYHERDKEYSLSLQLSRGNWTLGGGYRKTYVEGHDKRKADDPRLPEFFDNYREGQAFEVGLGYEFGPFESAVTYYEAKADNSDHKDKVVMFSNQYQLDKNIRIYAAAAHVDFEGANHDISENNQGYAFIAGVGLNF